MNYNNYLAALKQSLENDDPSYQLFAQYVYEKLIKLEKHQARELYEKCYQKLDDENKVEFTP